jgi:hypothetical protein
MSTVHIVRHDYATMSKTNRRAELTQLKRISCMKNNKGVPASYIAGKFHVLLKYNYYGEKKGIRRAVTDLFVLYENGRRVAFAVMCAPGIMFHRLRAQFVYDSVYLALLCGHNANVLMNEIMKIFREKWITLDSLDHAIGYYLRPQLGRAYMIDTRASFWASDRFRAVYDYHNGTSEEAKRTRDAETQKVIDEYMKPQMRLGETFVARADSGTRRSGPEDKGYTQAHIVIPPVQYEKLDFDAMCYREPHDTGLVEFLDRNHTIEAQIIEPEIEQPREPDIEQPRERPKRTCTGANCAPARSTRRTGSAGATAPPRATRSRTK